MEAVAGKTTKSIGSNTPPDRTGDAKAVPNYLRPSAGSCHHVCKYGGKHTFEGRDAHTAQPKPRKQPAVSDDQKRMLIKARSVSRRRVGDFSKPEKANKAVVDKEKEVETVKWKDIVAYDTVPAYEESSPQPEKILAEVTNSGDGKKKDVMKGKRSHDKAKITEQEIDVKKKNESLSKKLVKSVRSKLTGKASTEPQAANKVASPSLKNTNTGRKSVKPPRVKKAATLPVEKKAVDQQMVQGDETTDVKEGITLCPLDQEEYAAAESRRPIPVHRRVKSMSISSRSVRFPFVRQASKNSATFKLRSKSSKGPILPSEEEKPTRLRFRKGRVAGEESSSGIQLRIRSLRRRGVGVSGGANTGFVVPAVTLKHQKTLEKKRSQRLYNNLIEETASKLAKTRKSRVKALVGAFETLISKIGK